MMAGSRSTIEPDPEREAERLRQVDGARVHDLEEAVHRPGEDEPDRDDGDAVADRHEDVEDEGQDRDDERLPPRVVGRGSGETVEGILHEHSLDIGSERQQSPEVGWTAGLRAG